MFLWFFNQVPPPNRARKKIISAVKIINKSAHKTRIPVVKIFIKVLLKPNFLSVGKRKKIEKMGVINFKIGKKSRTEKEILHVIKSEKSATKAFTTTVEFYANTTNSPSFLWSLKYFNSRSISRVFVDIHPWHIVLNNSFF